MERQPECSVPGLSDGASHRAGSNVERRRIGMRRAAVLGVALLVTLLAAGSASPYFGKPSHCTNGSKSLKGKTIGLSFEESLSLFSQLQTDIKKFASLGGCGLKFKITNANGDPAKQLTDSQSLIAQKVDLLFTNPAEPQGWERRSEEHTSEL